MYPREFIFEEHPSFQSRVKSLPYFAIIHMHACTLDGVESGSHYLLRSERCTSYLCVVNAVFDSSKEGFDGEVGVVRLIRRDLVVNEIGIDNVGVIFIYLGKQLEGGDIGISHMPMLDSTDKHIVHCAEYQLIQCTTACIVLLEVLGVGLVCLADGTDLGLGVIFRINRDWAGIGENDKYDGR